MNKTQEIAYTLVIPSAYCIPKRLLQEYHVFMQETSPKKQRGRPRQNEEKIIAGIYYLLRTGCQWQALPLCFGSSKTVYHWFSWLVKIDAFRKIWKNILGYYNDQNGLELNHQVVDSSHKKSPLGGEKTGVSPVDRRKRGTKIVLATDGQGIPLAAALGAGNAHDTRLLGPLFAALEQQIPQSSNHFFHTDKGFSSDKNRKAVVSRNYSPCIPFKKNQKQARVTSVKKDSNRWVVERTFSWLSRFRRIYIRYEKKAATYLALVQFACQIIILDKI